LSYWHSFCFLLRNNFFYDAMRKLTLLLLLAFSLHFTPTFSQNRAFPNAIHAKLNAIDYGLLFNNEVKVGQGFEFAYFRNIAPALNVGLPLKLGLAKLPGVSGNTVVSSLDLVFRLENIRSDRKIIPFAFAGAGYILEGFENGHVQFPFGAGVHFRLSPYAFISLQGEFRKALIDDRDNLQIGLGYVYLLHKSENQPEKKPMITNDNDNDGVANDLDKCPNDPGPALALGCPDRDNDGIGDTEDLCPEEEGTFDTGGCPDYDKDGVADKDDDCPNDPGPWNGCPDTDYDGVADKDDKCPTESGSATNMGCPDVVAADADADGFADDIDLCPDKAGALSGCPDSDGDGVADNVDLCPDKAGALNGCPDADGDGIADNVDLCPDKAGALNGCPDTDGDGIADNVDLCPDKAGSLNGCPDSDGDGIADKDDMCPNLVGVANNNGCPVAEADPDSDGDGFADKTDPCPNKAGALGGCPDSDGDNVADNLDKCPSVFGPASNNGCPVPTADPDSDGDGFADKTDPCPNKAGAFGGCPDSDGDNVADNLDKCPTTAGPSTNFGCPEVKKESKERLVSAAQAVQFETAKAILKDESYSILDEILAIMRENPAYTLSISGYTDDIGNEEGNLSLSQNRAKACYDYLQFRGIKSDRLRYAGFGESRPIADNKTAEGRELNRRVEFELLLD
jgi:outer membrane protein OmpA-like peptidoglycan-associated protein